MVRRRTGQKRARRQHNQARLLTHLGGAKDQDTDGSYSTDVEPPRRSHADTSSQRQAAEPKFFKAPLKVIYYSWLYVHAQVRSAGKYMGQHPRALLYSAAVGIAYTLLHFVRGPHARMISALDASVSWYSYWVALGVLSSIGLGAGLHTFVLFLGPHIARVTLTAHECMDVSFAVRGARAFECVRVEGVAGFGDVLRKVLVESLCWGAGTAIGELPPYFIARAAAQGSELERLRAQTALSLKDRTLLGVHSLLRRFGFLGILLFAAIPNPLFDLAGITCGHFQIPFWTFFGATLLGKSVIKATVQTMVVITAFSEETISGVLLVLQRWSPWVHSVASRVLSQQMAFGQESESSVLGSMWNACVALMLVYFVVSTLEAFAQSYVTDIKRWSWQKR